MRKIILNVSLLITLISCSKDNNDDITTDTCANSLNKYTIAKANYELDPSSINCTIYRNAINNYVNNCNLIDSSFEITINSLGNCNNEDE